MYSILYTNMSPKNLGFNRSGIPPHASTHLVDLTLDKASDALKKYLSGERKTKPTQKMLEVLEANNVISKSGAGYSKVGGGMPKRGMKPAVMPPPVPPKFEGGINRLKKATRWRDFSADTAEKGIDLYSQATNPYGYAVKKAITGGKVNRLKKGTRWRDFSADTVEKGIDLYSQATNPYGYAVTKAISGGAVKKPSAWISFVKEFAQKNNIPYKEALKAASGPYKQMKSGSGYSSAN